jgi:hypothetical protein
LLKRHRGRPRHVYRWVQRFTPQQRQYRVGFVECDQAVDVTGVEPLDDEAAQVLRLRGAFCVGMHADEPAAGATVRLAGGHRGSSPLMPRVARLHRCETPGRGVIAATDVCSVWARTPRTGRHQTESTARDCVMSPDEIPCQRTGRYYMNWPASIAADS